MESSRTLYKQKYEAQMHEWSAKLDAMKAQTEKLSAQAKIDVKPHVEAMSSKFEAAKAKVAEIAAATDDKWDDVVKQVEHTWNDFKSAAEGAFDAIKPHHKD